MEQRTEIKENAKKGQKHAKTCKNMQKHTTAGIRWWSPTQLLICRSEASTWIVVQTMPLGLVGERRRPQDIDGLTMLLPCQGRPPPICDGDQLDPQKLGAISRRVAPRHWMAMGERVSRVSRVSRVGLPEEKERELREFEGWLREASRDGEDVNQWRSSTPGVINKKGCLDHLAPRTNEIASSLVSEIMGILQDITDIGAGEQRDTALRALILEAISLSRMLRVQKANFKLLMPVIEEHQINTFDAETMDDIGGEDEETLEGREILCITFPGVLKEGDENGQRLQLRNVIAKAKVLCSPN